MVCAKGEIALLSLKDAQQQNLDAKVLGFHSNKKETRAFMEITHEITWVWQFCCSR